MFKRIVGYVKGVRKTAAEQPTESDEGSSMKEKTALPKSATAPNATQYKEKPSKEKRTSGKKSPSLKQSTEARPLPKKKKKAGEAGKRKKGAGKGERTEDTTVESKKSMRKKKETGKDEKMRRIEETGLVFLRKLKERGWPAVEGDYRRIFTETAPPQAAVGDEATTSKSPSNFNHATRVRLSTNAPNENDFVAANRVNLQLRGGRTLNFIVTSTPSSLSDVERFWRLVYDTQAEFVVVLSDLAEVLNDTFRIAPRNSREFDNYGCMAVSCKKCDVSKFGGLSAVLEVLPEGCSNSVNPQFVNIKAWLTSIWWPRQEYDTINLIARQCSVRSQKSPLVVTCPDGLSRACIFIAISAAFECIEDSQQPDLSAVLRSVREQRFGAFPSLDDFYHVHLLVIYWLQRKIGKKLNEEVKSLIDALATHRRTPPSLPLPAPPPSSSMAK